jgi:hypothetical protein
MKIAQTTGGTTTTADLLALLAKLVTTYGLRGLVIASRAYLGPASLAADRLAESERTVGFAGLTPVEVALLGLALSKLAWEAGELSLHNASVSGDGQLPSWQLDTETHRPPALSLAHMIAIKRVWDARSTPPTTATMEMSKSYTAATPLASARTMRLAARSAYYVGSRTSGGTTMATTTTALTTSRPRTGGCGCGGAKAAPAPAPVPRTPVSDPCSPCVGTAPPPPTPTASCACGCGGCASCVPATKTYDSSQCPTWAISCETKAALKDCVKQALCDFARCVTDTLCPGGRYDPKVLQNKDVRQELADCVGQLACSFLHCVPDALCPPDDCAPPQVPSDCMPCGYAVEVLR